MFYEFKNKKKINVNKLKSLKTIKVYEQCIKVQKIKGSLIFVSKLKLVITQVQFRKGKSSKKFILFL